MEIAIFIVAVIGIVLCYKLSTSYNRQVEKKYGQGCVNWWLSVANAILAVITFGFAEDIWFYIFLMLTIGLVVISLLIAYKTMIGWGSSKQEAWKACAAQFGSTVGIAAAILLVLLLLFGGSNRRKRR